jgi:hypothetical protein
MLWHAERMPDEDQLSLRQADQARKDFASITEDLDFIKSQLSRLPTRRELALRPLYVMLGSAGLVILWIELFRRVCL